MRPLGDSSIDPLVVTPVNREGAVENAVTKPELVTDQAEFNVVLERWFGELALAKDVRNENEGPRGLVLKGRLSTIFGSDLPVLNKADINTM